MQNWGVAHISLSQFDFWFNAEDWDGEPRVPILATAQFICSQRRPQMCNTVARAFDGNGRPILPAWTETNDAYYNELVSNGTICSAFSWPGDNFLLTSTEYFGIPDQFECVDGGSFRVYCMNLKERARTIGYQPQECVLDGDCDFGLRCARPTPWGSCVPTDGRCAGCPCAAIDKSFNFDPTGTNALTSANLALARPKCKPQNSLIGRCECHATLAPCTEGMTCVDGVCRCTTNEQCRTMYRNSDSICLLEDPDLSEDASPLGYCSCNLAATQRPENKGLDPSCGYNGACAPRRLQSGSVEATRFYARFDGGLVLPTSPGECACRGALLNDVYGEMCQNEVRREREHCSGRGTPVCSYTGPDDVPVRSRQTGQIIGARCQEARWPLRGDSDSRQPCLCDEGWGPDFNLDDSAAQCSIPYTCGRSGILVDTGRGLSCQCDATTDTYPVGNAVAQFVGSLNVFRFSCTDGCRAAKCSGHGTCVFIRNNDQIVVTGYANDCACDPGWRSSRERDYSEFGWPPSGYYLCDQPFELVTGTLCGPPGAGQWNPGTRACECVEPRTRPLDPARPNGASAVVYAMSAQSEMCEGICPTLGPAEWDAAAEGRPWPAGAVVKPCGGAARGECVRDTRYSVGRVCRCKNGYAGLACQIPLCPRAPGGALMCSGNGLCDASTGKCICAEGFIGDACETRDLGCGEGQSLRSRPLLGSELILPLDVGL
jgi:hypothetical protein